MLAGIMVLCSGNGYMGAQVGPLRGNSRSIQIHLFEVTCRCAGSGSISACQTIRSRDSKVVIAKYSVVKKININNGGEERRKECGLVRCFGPRTNPSPSVKGEHRRQALRQLSALYTPQFNIRFLSSHFQSFNGVSCRLVPRQLNEG